MRHRHGLLQKKNLLSNIKYKSIFIMSSTFSKILVHTVPCEKRLNIFFMSLLRVKLLQNVTKERELR